MANRKGQTQFGAQTNWVMQHHNNVKQEIRAQMCHSNGLDLNSKPDFSLSQSKIGFQAIYVILGDIIIFN